MQPPTGIPELRRFLGMANHHVEPCRLHTTTERTPSQEQFNAWSWGPCNPTGSFYMYQGGTVKDNDPHSVYNPAADMKVSADASSFGLGAAVLQEEEVSGNLWPSHQGETMLKMEKKALASTWACEQYILGIETDHKPLMPLLRI
jgi:hypothetical protein